MREAGELVSREAVREEWRCFHCNEVFTTRESASEHFGDGDYEDEPPVCLEAATTDKRKLVSTNRKVWKELQEALAENESLEDRLSNFKETACKVAKKLDANYLDIEQAFDFLEGQLVALPPVARVELSPQPEIQQIIDYLDAAQYYFPETDPDRIALKAASEILVHGVARVPVVAREAAEEIRVRYGISTVDPNNRAAGELIINAARAEIAAIILKHCGSVTPTQKDSGLDA
jgi:hypothetical protein